ncbi:MAG: hypothetical protein KF798_03340 [Candidatus Paracaedibacteraceae bacterium]|nr:hypothetical protein [Candidatus Paracaedibacteraceae bacterium]
MLFGSLQAYTIEQTPPTSQEKPRSTPQHTPKKWSPRIVFGGQYGNKRNLGQVSLFTPLGQTEDHLLYADLRFASAFNRSKEGSLGLGSRWITLNNKAILGIYAFYDHQLTKLRGTVNQMTLGAEILSETWDYRLNFYCPQNAKKTLETKQESPLLTSTQQEGANTYRVISQPMTMTKTKEVSLRGLDLEIGNSIPGLKNLRVYGGYYHYHGRKGVKSVNGIRLRGNLRLNHAVSIIAEGSHDKLRKTNAFVGLQLTLAIGSPSGTKKETSGLDQRMVELAERNRQIFTTQTTTTSTTSTPLSKTLLMGNHFPNQGQQHGQQAREEEPLNPEQDDADQHDDGQNQDNANQHHDGQNQDNANQHHDAEANPGNHFPNQGQHHEQQGMPEEDPHQEQDDADQHDDGQNQDNANQHHDDGQNQDNANQHHDDGENQDNPIPDQDQHHEQQGMPEEDPHQEQDDKEFPIALDPEQEQHQGQEYIPFKSKDPQDVEQSEDLPLSSEDHEEGFNGEGEGLFDFVISSHESESVNLDFLNDDATTRACQTQQTNQALNQDGEVQTLPPQQQPEGIHIEVVSDDESLNPTQDEAGNNAFNFDMSSGDSDSDSKKSVDLDFLNSDATTRARQTQQTNNVLNQDREGEILFTQQ